MPNLMSNKILTNLHWDGKKSIIKTNCKLYEIQ